MQQCSALDLRSQNLLKRLKRLLGRTGAKIVLSSTWRYDPTGILSAKYWGVPFHPGLAGLSHDRAPCRRCLPQTMPQPHPAVRRLRW